MKPLGMETNRGSGRQIVTQRDLKEIWGWNDTVPETVDRCLPQVVEKWVQSQPDASAVCAWDGELTYGELNRLATGLADRLADLGVGPDIIVPLCFEKSMWTSVAMLGVLKAGGGFVLLDPSLPRDRLRVFVRQVKAKLVLSSISTQSLSSWLAEEVVTVNSGLFAGQVFRNHRNLCKANPSSTAYVIFTSGSTGIPKGVIITHRNVTSAVSQYVKRLNYTADTRIYDFASYSFGVSINNALAALIAGGCLCVPSDNDRRSNLAGSLTSFRATVVILTPSMAELLSPQKAPSLRSIIFGGEAVRLKDVRPWWGQVKVINAYGCSECTSISTINAHAANPEEVTRIGKGAAGVTWVVDPENHDSLLPPGCTGELLVEGPLVGRGYLNELEKTAAAFIEDPAWLLQGAPGYPGRHGRLYKTGDLVRYNEDGDLIFIGRKDEQVKIRGQRVELGEVEHHVQECMPDVKQVVAEVIAPHGEKSSAMLVAFLQTDNNMTGADGPEEAKPITAKILPILAEVENKLGQLLPSYMLPTAFFSMRELPIGTTGKMNRKRLREIGASFSVQQLAEMQTTRRAPKRQPRSKVEQQMQGLWAQALAIEPATIGLDDSFFQLGGNSITAMKVVGEALKVGLQLAVADIFRCPSLQDIASQALASADKVGSKILSTQLDGPVEQSFAQGRLWFLEQLYPGSTWYLIPCVMRLRGSLQLDALNAAFLALEGRHETLRTTFSTHGGVHMQEIKAVRVGDLNVVDISPDDKESLMNALTKDTKTPFDLENEPGWRVSVYRLGKDDHILSIVMHHIISDGWSVDVLRKELAAFYAAAIQNQDPLSQVGPLPVQYRDYSLWQKQQDQLDEHQRQLEYWVTQLETSQPAELLCDKPRPAALSGKADVQELRIDGSLYDDLQRFCKEHEATPFIVLLAAFRATHYRLTGEGDATIGSPNANRDRAELKDMIGFFVNLQCIRIKIEDESFEELVQQVRASTVASFANQDVPFETIVSRLHKGRDLSRHPLAQIVFAVHSQIDLRHFTLGNVDIEQIPVPPTPRFDLEFHFFQEQQALQGEVLFSTDLYNPETISNMLSVFHRVLEQGLHEPKIGVATLPLLTDDNYSAFVEMGLIEIDRTDYPRESSIIDVFRRQAAFCPHKVAVKDSSTQLTYAQLDRKSDMLAWWLARRSFTPGTLIGVFSSRSCQTIIAFLGILKANLAYLPFDVKIPQGRMENILSSLQGHRLILLGSNVQSPTFQLKTIEFACIAEILDDQDEITFEDPTVAAAPSATSLAYVMFTSGSTGRPKGVMVEHRGIVRLVKQSNMVQHNPTTGTMAHMSNIAFDASTWEIYVTLLNGGTLICIDAMTVLDYRALAKIFTEEKVQAVFITPALLKQYLSECPAAISVLDTLYVGGDRADPQDMFTARGLARSKIINGYGPTENTSFSTVYCLPEEERCTNGVPIGRALSNSGAYVMDRQLHLVPLGVVGELVVTGDGLARGYTDPQQNFDRFVSVMIGGQQVKAYRTGDYVRYRPADGQLEYFGRMDGQIKIRGQRVELGEIEHALRSHGSVDDAVTILQHEDGREAQLVGFVTVREVAERNKEQDENDAAEHVEAWEELFEAGTYTAIDNMRPETIGRDFIGWTSMYDGSEIDKAEMNEWLDDTIETISNSGQSFNLLELGSGTGMILFNLTKGLQSYIGLDPSKRAVDFITKTAKSISQLADKVHMYKGTAADISRLPNPISPNLVVINSVAQYFPSQEYLSKLVEDLLQLEGVETLFFGDIRSYALYDEFRATRTLHMAGKTAGKDEFRQKMAELEKVELELLIDPAFFTALPNNFPDLIEHVEILPKRMKAINELSCYRYTAVVHVKDQGQDPRRQQIHQIGEDEWIDFISHRLDRRSLLQLVQHSSSSSVVAVSNIPYSKTIFERHVIDSLNNRAENDIDHSDWLSSARQNAQQCPSMSAVDLVELAQLAGCQVEISWARQGSQRGGLDAIFHHHQSLNGESRVLFRFPTDHRRRPPHLLSSQPLQQQIKQRLREQLRERLQSQLPSYMVPQVINILDKMPVNENGKVDRRALAENVQRQNAARGSLRQPTTDVERQLQKTWAQVLSIEPTTIGVDDNFFQLGGDSISAMRLVGLARGKGMTITVAEVFGNPKLLDLAGLNVTRETCVQEPLRPFTLLGGNAQAILQQSLRSCSVREDMVEDIYPCTPLQAGIMSLSANLSAKQKQAYVARLIFPIPEDISIMRLRSAWEEVVVSTPSLRTRIVQTEPYGFMQVVLKERIEWISSDDVDTYRQREQEIVMLLGDRLSRHALVRDTSSGSWNLVWSVHHALYDGWSIGLIEETLYKAYRGETRASAPPFNDFVKYLSERDHGQVEMFWKTYLAGSQRTAFPSLPSGNFQARPTGSVKRTIAFPAALQSGITMSVQLYTAWAILLGRYTESDDVIVGTTLTGRTVPVAGIEDMAGPTITTVPLRVKLSKEARGGEGCGAQLLSKTVEELLRDVQAMTTEVIPYQHAGLQNIQAVSKDAQEACDFCNLLVIQPRRDKRSSADSLVGDSTAGNLAAFHTYGFLLIVQLGKSAVEALVSFDSRVISAIQVQRLLGQLDVILQQMHSDTGVTVSGLAMVSKEDEADIEAWTGNTIDPVEECIHHLVEGRIRQQPNAPAVCSWDGDLTYQELGDLSTRLANHLKDLGVAPETVVPLAFEKSKWTIVAMLGVLKAGGAFVLLDVAHPGNRLRLLCLKVKASVVVASPSASAKVKFVDTVVIVDEQTTKGFPVSSNTPSPRARSCSAAYVIFTSGSTGEPKGCLIEHGSYCTAASGHGPAMGMNVETRSLQFASYSFAATFMETLTTLLQGGCVCVLSEDERANDIAQSIQKRRANWAFLTPSLVSLLDPGSVSSLSELCIGGESIQLAQIERWSDKVNLRQTYGSAETSAVVSAAKLNKSSTTRDVGNAVTGKYWIVEPTDYNKLAPVGTVGELIVEGRVIGRSYIDEPEKTAAAFIEKPDWRKKFSSPIRGSRFYKTGDLVKYNDDGALEYIGRKDAQVKLRGQRIELGEIEYHARRAVTDKINMAAELIVPGSGKRENAVIILFVAVEEDATGEAIELLDISSTAVARVRKLWGKIQAELETLLPSFMVPSVFLPLRRLPMTVSGKVHRKRLREIGSSLSAQQLAEAQGVCRAQKRPPSTQTERTLQSLWAQILNLQVDEIGLDDSFFQLGGDSISAMRLVGLARAAGLQLMVAQIFKHPRLRDMSSKMGCSDLERPIEVVAQPFTAIDVPNVEDFLQNIIQPKLDFSVGLISDILPTTDFQEWVLKENFRTPPLMLSYFFVQLNMKIDRTRMEGACAAIIKRHEILRTIFVGHNERHLQVVLRDLHLPLTHYDVNGDLEAFSTALCHRDRAEGLQLGAPFGRFMLVCVDENRYRLIIRLSHTQYDGFCIPQLLDDLASAYRGELISSVGNFPAFVYDHIRRAPLAHEYWRRLLHGSNMTCITSRLRPVDTTSSILVEASSLVDLRGLPGEFTAATLATASWAILLSKVTNENDVVFGRVVAGRSSEMLNLENIFGPCLNIAPMRVRFLPEWTTIDLLTAIQEQQISSGPFESTGITEITNHCTDWPKGTEFDSFIRILSSQLTDSMSPFGEPTGVIKANVPTNSKFSITSTIRDSELRFHLIAYSDLIDPKTADWLLNKLSTIGAHLLISSDIFGASR